MSDEAMWIPQYVDADGVRRKIEATPGQPLSVDKHLKIKVLMKERGCDAQMGCGCLGTCRELIEVVSLEDAARLAGALEMIGGDLVTVEFVRERGR